MSYLWSVKYSGDSPGNKLVIRRRKSCPEASEQPLVQGPLHPNRYNYNRHFSVGEHLMEGREKTSVGSLLPNSAPTGFNVADSLQVHKSPSASRAIQDKNERNAVKKLDWILSRFQPKIMDLFKDDPDDPTDQLTENPYKDEVEKSDTVQKKKQKTESTNEETVSKVLTDKTENRKQNPRKNCKRQDRILKNETNTKETGNETRNKSTGVKETGKTQINQTAENKSEIKNNNLPSNKIHEKQEEIIIVVDDDDLISSNYKSSSLSKEMSSNKAKVSIGDEKESFPVSDKETENNSVTFCKERVKETLSPGSANMKEGGSPKEKKTKMTTQVDDDVIIVEDKWDVIVIDED